MAKDYYDELGVSRSASADEIKKAFKKLTKELHPDRNQGDADKERRFKAVNRAHQVLSDEKKRALYDEFGEEGLREGFDPDVYRAYRSRGRRGGGPQGNINFEDIFSAAQGSGVGDMFGDLFGGGRRRNGGGGFGNMPMKGSDVLSEVQVSFVDAIAGSTMKLRLQDGGEEVSVRIPPGADDGDKVRVKGHGAPGMGGGPAGDLILSIRVSPHPYFERDGLDLHVDLPISVTEAYYGAKVRVPTPGGDVTLTVPKGAQSGQLARLKGRGVKRKDKVGDIYARFIIKLPEGEDEAIEAAIKTLGEATGDVRSDLRF
ncbi:MAG: DnaJ domain-containing protein [Polyangiaceae bacterium]|nr:DnaJ domain-containing protein [Myxococcales bacterium]MCB9585367.1 DnaJ domain-containing protein [Polyangiaceae bacterium]MCB9606618.1 DnaJ domain-containing protein [Polyangiaceae bacterium]